jgi:hypothetical protein
MTLVGQWQEIERSLPASWGDARLALTVAHESRCVDAAALLGPANPGRHGKTIRFFTARRGAGIGPEGVRRLLECLDREGIEARLELVSTGEAPPEPALSRPTLAEAWHAALAVLPADWTDLYCEVELTSTDQLERAALLLAPVNPARFGGTPGFRYRVARRFGYGASPEMAARCLARLDEDCIPGEVRILVALSDTHPASTQGPVWHVGGKTV